MYEGCVTLCKEFMKADVFINNQVAVFSLSLLIYNTLKKKIKVNRNILGDF